MIKAVIFDLDGTLIDTEKYYHVAWPETFRHFGHELSEEDSLLLRSLGKPFVQPFLRKISGDPELDYDSVVKYRQTIVEDLIAKNGIQVKKGAFELLSFLKERGIVRAIATASPEERARRYLLMAGLDGAFERIISARDMKEGKPSPDVYLYAVKQLGLSKDECIAVEDSPNGVLSAYRAGLKVVMIPDLAPCDVETKKLLFAEKEDLSKIIDLL